MDYRKLYGEYVRFVRSEENIAVQQQLYHSLLHVFQEKGLIDSKGEVDPKSTGYNDIMGRYLAGVVRPDDASETYFGYLYRDTGWSNREENKSLSPQECKDFALLSEYALRSGNVQGAIMLHACYHFGVGVPQSFHQAIYFAKIALAGLGNLWESGLMYPDFDEEELRHFWQRTILSFIVADSMRLQVQSRSHNILYSNEWLSQIRVSDLFAAPMDYMAIFYQDPADEQDVNNMAGTIVGALRNSIDAPFVADLKEKAHKSLYYAQKNKPTNLENAQKEWTNALNNYLYAASLGDAEAAAGVGYCFEQAPVRTNDPRRIALAWYKCAAKMGSSWAMERVGQYYEMGLCGEVNRAIAQKCYEAARQMGKAV